MIYLIIGLAFMALVFLPQYWVWFVIARHSVERHDFPGTGAELARHLLDEAGLTGVKVEYDDKRGDHYDPVDKAVRLAHDNHNGRSVSAVAIAAHEVSHALQDAQGYGPFKWRTALVVQAHRIEQVGSIVLLATPVVALLTRSPVLIGLEILAGLGILGSAIFIHAVTLPVEFDASFGRALPMLKAGKYLAARDLPAARKVLRAAALTYVSGALISLIDIARWIRILR